MLFTGLILLKLNTPPAINHESDGSLHTGESIPTHSAEDVHPRYTTAGRPACVHAIANFDEAKICMQFLRTEEFEELLLAWIRAGLEQRSFSFCLLFLVPENNIRIEIASQPSAVIRVGIKKRKNKGHQSIGNLHLERKRCSNITTRRKSRAQGDEHIGISQ